MSQRTTPDDVREEHLSEVSQPAHWIYLIGVIVAGLLLMLGFIALLGSTGP
jgi:hypothetical protein